MQLVDTITFTKHNIGGRYLSCGRSHVSLDGLLGMHEHKIEEQTRYAYKFRS